MSCPTAARGLIAGVLPARRGTRVAVVVAFIAVGPALPLSVGAQPSDPNARDAGRADAGRADAAHADAGQADAGTDASVDAQVDAQVDAGRPDVRADDLPPELAPTITVTVAPTDGLMTGDIARMTMDVTARDGDRVSVPEQSFAPFEVLATESTESPGNDGWIVHRFELELLALEPGEHTVGPVRVRVLTANGTLGSAHSEPVAIGVGSVLGNEPNAEPKPPTDPVEVLEEDYTLAWVLGILGAVLLLAIIMFFVARWWVRRERPLPPPPPPRPPWDIAIERLEALRQTLEARTDDGQVVAWADELSDTVREYLGRRYEFDGLESTTDEVIEHLHRRRPAGLSVEEVAALLGDLDLVKFAKASPGLEQCEAALDTAFRIVKTTRPIQSFAEPPAPKAPPSAGANRHRPVHAEESR